MATRTVYFDTNVYDHICKRLGVADDDIAALRRYLCESGRAALLLSVHDVEEASRLAGRSQAEARGQVHLMTNLARRDRFFREPRDLIEQSVRSVTENVPPPDPFVPDPEVFASGLAELLRGDQAAQLAIEGICGATEEQVEDFREGMVRAQEQTRLQMAKHNPSGRRLPFEGYFTRSRRIIASGLIERVTGHVSDDQIDGLLALPYPRAYVDASTSLIYAYMFERRAPDSGDGRDLLHAGLGGFVDTFVVNDRRLRRLLERIPQRGYAVTDLVGFLRSIRSEARATS